MVQQAGDEEVTQQDQDQQRPKPDRLAPAIRLLAVSVIFLAGAVMFGLCRDTYMGTIAIADTGRGTGGFIMVVSGIAFVLTLFGKL